MTTETELKAKVRARYGAIAEAARDGCGCCGEMGADLVRDQYDDVQGHVAEADLGLGCGLPTRHAGIKAGDTVLDLGAGAGNDAFVALPLVGEHGRVIGVDMTPAMIDKARVNAAKLGATNVDFRLDELEALPVADASIDVVISNCVLNLVPDKAAAYAEMFRVLRPGAHFCISDIVASGELPASIRSAAELHVGCVAGAMAQAPYLALIEAAGFTDLRIAESREIHLPDEMLAEHLDQDELLALRASGAGLSSVTLLGTKPAAACCDASCCS